jgi:hypothetical protein
MADITKIVAEIRTGNFAHAGADGWVYLGIGGREFRLGRPGIDDFEQNTNRSYVLGSGANVEDAALNDPRVPQLDTSDLERYPVYIRFEPGAGGDWNFDGAEVTITPGGAQYARMLALGNLWLGQKMGKFCYLKKVN